MVEHEETEIEPKPRKTALGSRGHLCGTEMVGWDSSFYFTGKLHPYVHITTENAACSRDASTVVVASQGLKVTVLGPWHFVFKSEHGCRVCLGKIHQARMSD